jgi:hypothetical protein
MPLRVGQLLIQGDLLTGWLRDGVAGFLPRANHLPVDVRLLGAYTFDWANGVIALVFASEHFPAEWPEPSPFLVLPELPLIKPVFMTGARLYDIPFSLN